MSVAALIVHASDPWQRQEFALLYAVIYVTLLLVGSGRYSLDHAIATRLESGQKVPLAEL
jgi:putative oxidoreductase